MPQITLEYTANLHAPRDFQALFSELHRILTDTGGVRLDNCKSRAVCQHEFRMGDGSERHAFVNVTLNLMKGRSLEWKRDIGERFLNALMRAYHPETGEFDLQITVNIGDIAHETYFKYPQGTLTSAADAARKVS